MLNLVGICWNNFKLVTIFWMIWTQTGPEKGLFVDDMIIFRIICGWLGSSRNVSGWLGTSWSWEMVARMTWSQNRLVCYEFATVENVWDAHFLWSLKYVMTEFYIFFPWPLIRLRVFLIIYLTSHNWPCDPDITESIGMSWHCNVGLPGKVS